MSLKQERIVWTGFMWLWIGTNGEFCENPQSPSRAEHFSRTSLHVVSRMLVRTNVIKITTRTNPTPLLLLTFPPEIKMMANA